ncbi:MAG: transcriptional repressor NrdR [Calditrichaeota bacterium]|nr:transcriptional repressor NrdR [Calditrichota bacterium]MCB9368428.1 transcriptional repressor NrdR [Calditrichota bacterium]
MRCPFCSTDDDRVIDSRPAKEGRAIRRRRECLKCGHRFTTYESIEVRTIQVIKSDGAREPFDREKVYRGLSIACIKRPVTAEMIENMTDSIEAHVFALAEREVTAAQIGQWILEELSKADEVAYVRFASVYKRYASVDEFLDELKGIRSTHA